MAARNVKQHIITSMLYNDRATLSPVTISPHTRTKDATTMAGYYELNGKVHVTMLCVHRLRSLPPPATSLHTLLGKHVTCHRRRRPCTDDVEHGGRRDVPHAPCTAAAVSLIIETTLERMNSTMLRLRPACLHERGGNITTNN